MPPQKIIIDTDPGIDDSMAIFFALSSPELEVIGLTTVFGNVHVDLAVTNALRLLEIAGRTDIPVAKGAANSLVGDYANPPTFIHGDDGQGNAHLPPPAGAPIAQSSAQFIVEQVMASPGEERRSGASAPSDSSRSGCLRIPCSKSRTMGPT